VTTRRSVTLGNRPHRAAALVLVLVALTPVLPAGAHAFLVRSSPGRRATVSTPPPRVQLWFNERLEPAFSQASVWDEGGAQVDFRDGRVEPADPLQLSVGIPALAPGVYSVRFRVLSVDGHVVESQFPFTVRAAR
jgi:methionine-rich copper-binding protein CopC